MFGADGRVGQPQQAEYERFPMQNKIAWHVHNAHTYQHAVCTGPLQLGH
jgi:hypothetical protein